MTVWILLFNEWGWDDGEDNHPQILGVFTTITEAEKYQVEAKKHNTHGSYDIKMAETNKYYQYGC